MMLNGKSKVNVTKISLLVLTLTILLAGPAPADNLAGDLDSSGTVNMEDLEIFAGQWLDDPGCVGHPDDCADMVGDDGVNMADFSIMGKNWLKHGIPLAPGLSLPANGLNTSGASIDFLWNASTGADDYYLQVAADSGFSRLIYDGAVGDTTSINLGPFPDDGSSFYWRMRAGYFAGEAPEVPFAEYLVSAASDQWHYRKGNSEPPSDWREVDFTEDRRWLVGQTSIGYGDDDDNTELTDMRGNYSTVYLRHSFEFETTEGYVLDTLNLRALVDDGCIVTLNGRELHRFHVSAGDKTYQGTGDNHEASAWEQYEVTDPSKFPLAGTNVLAVHALNQSISSSDFTIDIELIANFVPTGTGQWSEYSDTWHFYNGPPPVSELTIAGVYLAQTHVLEPDDPLFKLVGNRPALLKVQVIAPNGTAVPPVKAVLSVGRATTTLTLDGPDTLQDTFKVAPGLVQHRYDDSFTTLIPAEWIRPRLNIAVTAGSVTVDHDIKVGAPTEVKMKMFDVHYFGLGNRDYPAGAFDELEAKWPVAGLDIERVRNIDFPELVIPARSGAPNVRVTSKQDYRDQTGLSFDGEQAAALQWVEALSASGGNFDVAMQYINIIGVAAGAQAGGFDGVGGVSLGILNHELGHALSLPHWGDSSSYPYKGEMYGIEPQPGVYKGTHVGPTWAFDLPSMTFIPPTVQENSVGGEVGYYKKSPMQGGGVGDQEQGFFFRHFSDFGVKKMQSYLEGKVAVYRDGEHYKWDDEDGGYTRSVTNNGVRYPIEHDVQVISVMASMTLSDRNVNMVYPPIGPYEGNLILTFDPTKASDRATADDVFCPSGGCDFTLRVVQGGQQRAYMLPASGTEGADPYSRSSLKTEAVNLRASDGAVTRVELLLTPDAEKDGLPGNPEVLYIWTD